MIDGCVCVPECKCRAFGEGGPPRQVDELLPELGGVAAAAATLRRMMGAYVKMLEWLTSGRW